ncbi:uncharacterized protein ACA1_246530 [Acanthamoeba castellanii str. Neff]|uniref:Uncharacterized protein n=1 Tax=Acanthamoeba castellanii (strain ATCC 30010 / Neff) TaxID=1257118 RepID=L8GK78_ACACF|nr:uncharacterized protein ACA1_246530 [Acanthamoeba castellanii str. Neff]ELR13490.1 hypothetical protein ACA1_246530 [Acanthamoeba castellanii str. Neff]
MGGRLLRSLFGLALLAGLFAVASSSTGVGVPTTTYNDQFPGGVESYRGRRAVDESTQCVYVASLKTSMDSGNVGLKGSVVAYNESGLAVATFTSMPLAVAVDPVSYSLFVSTPANIQQYDISANLASGQMSCPCSFSTLSVGESVIQLRHTPPL